MIFMRIGVDLGATAIKAGLVDYEGNILRQSVRPTPANKGYIAVVNEIVSQIKELCGAEKQVIESVRSIGIGVPGVVNSDSGKVDFCANLSWNNVELGKEMRSRLNKKVYAANDATVAALAENLFGCTKGAANSVLITLGTGIGSGIILNGRIFSGSHALGSEIGHTIVGENFYRCSCGNNGCLETFASASAIVKYVNKKIEEGEKSSLSQLSGGAKITAEKIFEEAKKGDGLALQAVDRLCAYLAIGIINIYNTLDPDVIALGGGLSKAGDFLLDRVKEKTQSMKLIKNKNYGGIVLASLGNKAGVIGAAFLERFVDKEGAL